MAYNIAPNNIEIKLDYNAHNNINLTDSNNKVIYCGFKSINNNEIKGYANADLLSIDGNNDWCTVSVDNTKTDSTGTVKYLTANIAQNTGSSSRNTTIKLKCVYNGTNYYADLEIKIILNSKPIMASTYIRFVINSPNSNDPLPIVKNYKTCYPKLVLADELMFGLTQNKFVCELARMWDHGSYIEVSNIDSNIPQLYFRLIVKYNKDDIPYIEIQTVNSITTYSKSLILTDNNTTLYAYIIAAGTRNGNTPTNNNIGGGVGPFYYRGDSDLNESTVYEDTNGEPLYWLNNATPITISKSSLQKTIELQMF